jgi:hypothetical protein
MPLKPIDDTEAGNTLINYSFVSMTIIVVLLGCKFFFSLGTMVFDSDPTQSRYKLSQFRFVLTLVLDCLILNKFCSVGCFN